MRSLSRTTVTAAMTILLLAGSVIVPGVIGGRDAVSAAEAPARFHGRQEAEYVGSRACRRCHLREYRSWQESKHAKAFGLLSPGVAADSKRKVNLVPDQDFRANEFCLQCHTVGYQRPGGFVSLEETPERVGVGCENCHGPGGDYIADDVMGSDNRDHSFDEVRAAGLIWPVPEATCRVCHGGDTPFNAELFPEFTIEYSRETLARSTHEHPPLRRDHGPLPPGVLFQQREEGAEKP